MKTKDDNNCKDENLLEQTEQQLASRTELFYGPPLKWNSDELRSILLKISDKYSYLSDEELFDITPFDVLNDINKLI